MLTHCYVKENFDYDPDTGIMKRRKRMGAGARVWVKKKSHCLGYFKNLEDAVEAYRIGSVEHFGQYARAA